MIVEISPQRADMAGQIASRLALSGAALIVDYGYCGPALGDSFQAVKRHSYADPLSCPGAADLTAHVDFSALCQAARAAGARPFGPLPQGQFLTALGIALRAEKLKEINPERAAEIDAALARLIGAEAMGGLFKVAAFTGPDAPAPPPFAD
jgi:NADH dehydrogenase [ubiquinone] 1 alpha subcomplex assembly factor 7